MKQRNFLERDLPAHWPTGASWTERLQEDLQSDGFQQLCQFVAEERKAHEIFPSEENVFRAFELTPLENVRVVILGQDPYHGPGQAQGLSFSVPDGFRIPPSLRNIFKELAADLDCEVPGSGDLSGWAEQGVLLLNTVLTVRNGEAHSHRDRGWETFTDRVIQELGQREMATAFVLWGKPAARKAKWIDCDRHLVIESPHPSPLSASRGFFGSKPFSKINFFLSEKNLAPIQWTR